MEENKKTGYPHIDKPWMKYYDAEKLKEESPKTNLIDYIRLKNGDNKNKTAINYYGNKLSYSELSDSVDAYSKMLVGAGIGKGDRILYLVPNIPESGMLWLASSQIGVESDFIDPRPDSMDMKANADKVFEIIKNEKITHIIALDKCYLAMLKPIEDELKDYGIDQILTVSATNSMTLPGTINYLKDVVEYNKLRNLRIDDSVKKLRTYEALYEKIKAMNDEKKYYEESVKTSSLKIIRCSDLLKNCKYVSFTPVYDENLISYIGHTSGTSGARPKPIALTNKNQISSCEQIFKGGLNFKKGDKVLHELPFFSPMGADNNFILSLACGTESIEVPEFEINEFGYLLKKYHPNIIIGTPAWLAALPDCRYLDKEDMSCINRIIYGGDSMSKVDEEKLNLWLRRHGSSSVVEKGHGMSEYCGCGSYARKPYNYYDSIGIPFPETTYAIVDPNVDDKLVPIKFDDCEDYVMGELAVSSDAVTSGMLDEKIIIPHYDMDGKSYIRTRDLVKMNHDGLFFFDSRKDRSFTRFDGYKIKPYEIENVICKNDSVRDVRIVEYYDDRKRGFMPIAHIVLKDELDLDEQERIDLVREIVYNQIIANPTMSSRQIPAKFKIRESLPLSKNGKVSFKELIKEGIDGSEINVDIEETNISVGDINIYKPVDAKGKVLTLKK